MVQPKIDQYMVKASKLAYHISYDSSHGKVVLDTTSPEAVGLIADLGFKADEIQFADMGDSIRINACLYAYSSKIDAFILAFRGTLPPSKEDTYWFDRLTMILDWLQDGKAGQVPCDGVPGLIHHGMRDAFNTLRDSLKSWGVGHRKLYITGHSKGGALAHLTALGLWLTTEGKTTVQDIVTFGAPRLGNSTFQQAYDKELSGKTRRYEYGNDIVPHLPVDPDYLAGLGDEAQRRFLESLVPEAERHTQPDYKAVGQLQYSPEGIASVVEVDSPALRAVRIATLAIAAVKDGKTLIEDHSLSNGYFKMAGA